MRRLGLFFATVLLTFLPAASYAQTLTIALRADPDTLDPTFSNSFTASDVAIAMCDTLFDLSPKLQIIPKLATSYQWQDPKTLIVHLRDGVTFQDGEPMDASAVRFSLDHYRSTPTSFRKLELASIDHVDVVDPLTVRIALKTPDATIPYQLTYRAGMMLAPKVVEQEGADFGLHPVCAGPFAFHERVQNDHVTLDRFPGYWDAGNIHFEHVIYRTMPDESVRLANLQSGSIQLSEFIAPTDVSVVQHDPRLRIVTSGNLGFWGLMFNLANGPESQSPIGQDPRVRQAFMLSIDRAALTQVVYAGLFSPAAQATSSVSPFYLSSLTVPPRDIAKAKALLADAHVQLPVRVNLVVSSASDIRQASEVIQAMAAEAGFDVRITTMQAPSATAAGRAGNFQAYIMSWSGRPDLDGNLAIFYQTGSGLNLGHYADATVDSLLEQGREAETLPARRAIYEKLYAKINADLPMFYLWNPQNIVGMSNRLTGFNPVPDGVIRVQGLKLTGE